MDNMEIEIWKPVVGYEGKYEVSSFGRVKSLKYRKEKIMVGGINCNGYPYINLYINGIPKNIRVHRLVAIAFIHNADNKICVNHIDGNKTNNNISNLEWATYSDNISHAYRTGLNKSTKNNFFLTHKPSKGKFGSDHDKAIPVNQYTLDNIFIRSWGSVIEAILFTGATHISGCCKGSRKTAGGFIWKYAD